MNLDTDLLRISEWNWADGDTVRTIDYDAAGQVTAIVDSAFISPTCEWHDNYGELCYGGTPDGEVDQASFAYDAVGNRTDQSASVDTGNRLTDLGAFSFTHDGEGRTLTKSASGFLQTYHWNDRSQLDSVTTIDAGDTTVVSYTYDGLGRRISRDGPGGFEEYLYDGPHVIAILDDQQDVTSTLSYYPGVDKPHSLMTDTETYYYATDPTGSVSGLAEFTGGASVTHRYRYDVWGKPRGATEAVPNPLRFKARLWDDYTGLADFRARWYDPDIGRFISEDPIGLAGGINVYRFVGNDPVSGWDPFGLSECIVGWWSYTGDGSEVTGGTAGSWSDIPIGANPVYDDCPSNSGLNSGGAIGTGGYVDYATGGPVPTPLGTGQPSRPNSGPGGGRGSNPAPPIYEALGAQCGADVALLAAETAFEFTGANVVDLARRGVRGGVFSQSDFVTFAVKGSLVIPAAGTHLSSLATGRPSLGTNFRDLGRATGSGLLTGVGTVVELARWAPGFGVAIQAAGTGISCGSAAYAAIRGRI